MALASGCATGLRSIAPAGLQPVEADSVRAWAAEFRPAVGLEYELRWRFENDDGRAAGRAVARYAPPDTLRFDYRGPFGRSGSVLVIGNEPVWMEPEGDAKSLIPVAPVLWAALGIVRLPRDGDSLLGDASAERRAWRYLAADEVLDFIRVPAPGGRLLAEMRRADQIVSVVDVELAGATPVPLAAVMRFQRPRSTFSLTIRQVDTVAAFPPETWHRP
jgi:hypothetical protein